MRKLRGFALLLLLSFRLDAADLSSHAENDAAIRRIVAEQAVAWNAGDAKAYANHFAADGAFTNLFGMAMYGAVAFEQRHREILSAFCAATPKRHVVRRLCFLTTDVAIVDMDNVVRGVKALPAVPGVCRCSETVTLAPLPSVAARSGDTAPGELVAHSGRRAPV